MKQDKLEKMQELFDKRNSYMKIAEVMETGFSDEWVLKETYNGNTVAITKDIWELILAYTDEKIQSVEEEIAGIADEQK